MELILCIILLVVSVLWASTMICWTVERDKYIKENVELKIKSKHEETIAKTFPNGQTATKEKQS